MTIVYPVRESTEPEGEPDADTYTCIRDATGRELQTYEIVRALKHYRMLQECVNAAIKAGDWKVDGACDPTHLLDDLSERTPKFAP